MSIRLTDSNSSISVVLNINLDLPHHLTETDIDEITHVRKPNEVAKDIIKIVKKLKKSGLFDYL